MAAKDQANAGFTASGLPLERGTRVPTPCKCVSTHSITCTRR